MISKIISIIMTLVTFISSFAAGFGNDTVRYRDLAYGDDSERQILDLNIPKSVKGDANMILFVHGGTWCAGSKDDYEPVLDSYSGRGIISAAINYRYCGEPNNASVYDIMDDITSALKIIKKYARLSGVNLKGVMFDGGSAGAHLSLLYAYSRADEAPIKPVAVVAKSSVSDLTDETLYDGSLHKIDKDKWCIPKKEWCEHLTLMTGTKITRLNLKRKTDVLYDISPIKYIDENTVPTLIVHGTKDTVLPYSGAVRLSEKLSEYGVENDFITFEGAWHGLQDCPEGDKLLAAAYEKYIQKYVLQ